MLYTLLTVMLFIMPFLISQNDGSRPGLYTGLWISLFFWGRMHALFSILVFSVSAVYYVICSREQTTPSVSASWIPRQGTRPLTVFLAVLMVFCAFGNVCMDFGMTLQLDTAAQQASLFLGFAGSLAGPVFFGFLNDRAGTFTAFMFLLALGFLSLVLTALSPDYLHLFFFGSLFMQAVIGGVFTLMPLMLLRFYGRPQLPFVLPFLLLFLAALWAAARQFYKTADVPPQDYLLCMVFLLTMAAPLAAKAWRRRLTVL